MLRLFLMLLALCGTAQAAQVEVYFNNDIGIVFDEDQADIRFGMTLDDVRKAMKQTGKLISSGKEMIFDFACNSDDCTIDDGGMVVFTFVKSVLVSIMLSANNEITAEKYLALPAKIYGRGYDYRCARRENGGSMNSWGWKGNIKTTVTLMDVGGKGLVLTEFRTDKLRFNFRKSVCTPN